MRRGTRTRHAWARRALAGGALLLAACGASSKPAGGDRGNRRLHQLAADPVFARLPSGAGHAERRLVPARHQKAGFGSGGWSGPGVTLLFDSAEDPRAVLRAIGHEAEASGWTPTATGALGVPDRWGKRYANGARGTLTLFTPRPFDTVAGPRRYHLLGGISLPSD
jgi:hypothetical protein